MAASLRKRVSPDATDSRLRMCVAGCEKGRERRDVMRKRRRRRFLQHSAAVLGPSTSDRARRRFSDGLGACGSEPKQLPGSEDGMDGEVAGDRGLGSAGGWPMAARRPSPESDGFAGASDSRPVWFAAELPGVPGDREVITGRLGVGRNTRSIDDGGDGHDRPGASVLAWPLGGSSPILLSFPNPPVTL